MLCGESAGGGLCYALCLKLKELKMAMPCGIIAISPWTDLTASGESYKTNRDNDPSLTAEVLEFYAQCYAAGRDRLDPLLSPLFGDLTGMPLSFSQAAMRSCWTTPGGSIQGCCNAAAGAVCISPRNAGTPTCFIS